MINLSSLLIHFKLEPDSTHCSALRGNACFLCILHLTYTLKIAKTWISDEACFKYACCMQQLKGQSGIRSGSDEKGDQISNSLKNPALTSSEPDILYPRIKLYLTCILRPLIYQCLSPCGWLFILCSSGQFVLDASMSCSNLSHIGAGVSCPVSLLLRYSLLSPCTFDVRTSSKACDNLLWGFLSPYQAKVWNKQYGNQANGRNWEGSRENMDLLFLVSAKTDERIEKAN